MSSVRPKIAPATPKVVTAWDAASGVTVYRTPAGDWSEDLSAAEVVINDAAETALADAAVDQLRVVDPYFMEVTETGDVTGRETLRETIRATGPTIHPHYHKSAREKTDA